MEQNFLLRSPELVIKVIKVLKVHKELQVFLVVMVQLEHKVRQDQLVHKVLRDIKDCKVHRHT